ncbi:phospholipid-translocating ATPase [Wickerhamomyces ciferrii]|uniref:Phospholipid-transporting ATPase n=1 Tax=Wickerhamomyces ciferrii (strain ATCC 14091 / BCRC 22168 / CBS 111 / JCM 3599 / NBRC 0793 / NRRL Y-1031 F-60-10) TaxID=1206466 RepID=K0KHI1_WICCF|nr:phospholipid-translocating ATPase [Wickerhamomyces ciferrii]CCH40628.1 phospholipid-translocating ATPase [Wickerhamomyces ciferrii]
MRSETMGIGDKIHGWFVKPQVLEPRTVYFNQPLPESEIDPKHHRPIKTYDKNEIRTTKYTPFSFLPKNLFFQFQNIANVYFLFLIILGAFQIFGVQSPGLAAVPLCVIVVITAIKDAFEDSRRTISDLEVNNNPVSVLAGIHNHNVDETNLSLRSKFNNFNASIFVNIVNFFAKLFRKQQVIETTTGPRMSLETVRSSLRASLDTNTNDIPNDLHERLNTKNANIPQTSFKKSFWKNLKVGDIVRLRNNEEAPADIVVLSTSDIDNRCFIETKNLDGETNLKSREGLRETHGIRHSRDLTQLKFQLNSEAPSMNLYNYQASLKINNGLDSDSEKDNEVEESVNINNMLLRGSTLRNTKWAIGIVVFTGHETKIMLNSGITPTKKSRISKELNLSVLINFALLFILCLISGVINGVFYDKSNTSFKFFEFKAYGSTPAINGIISFFVAVILFQSLVPISLYISVEIVKTLQALFIYCDVKMYYEKLDYPCTPKSWNISDDLGQIEYIFSDKTGTLTQNVMEFKKATINGKSYGLAYTEAQQGMDKRKGVDVTQASRKWGKAIEDDRQQMIDILSKSENPHFNPESLTFISSEYLTDLLNIENKAQSEANDRFMLCLSLCHTVMTEPLKEDPSKFEFKAESPDEAALVQAASDVGYTFTKRTRNGGIVNIQGTEKSFDILKVLEFNSTRKRMSVIAQLDDEIHIISKGADSVIFERLDPNKNDKELLNTTAEHLEEYASEGLRTLCVAGRTIPPEEFTTWEKNYDAASSSLEDREEKMEALASEIESNLILLGGTAIEDRLQIGVPESIETLSKAGIKLWVLTGDKIETAINIGFSCNLLGNDMNLLVIRPEEGKDPVQDIGSKLDENLKKFNLTGSLDELKAAREDHSIPKGQFAVIVDGDALRTIFDDADLQRKFLLLCKQCKSVLCCRVSPAQKAQVVKLVRDSLDVMTLSIGDGANDVAMIQTANVGVGIVGEEGRQAAMSSDYAIGQFRFLTRLVLVHGRWSYKRLAEMIPSFFYKNIQFTMTLFWFGIFNDYDGSYLFEYTYIMFYNLAFTSLPVIFLAVFDQDVSDDISLRVPQLYMSGILRQEWSQYKFIYYMLDGLYQSVITFFFPYLIFYQGHIASYNGLNVDHRFWIGVYVTAISVTSVDIYVLLRQYRWDWLTLLIDSLSVLVVFFWSGVWSSSTFSGEFYKSAAQVFGQTSFWACYFVGTLLCVLPRFVFTTLNTFYRPRDIDIIRECAVRGDFNKDEPFSASQSDEEKEISNESSQITTRNSLDRVHTTHELPGLTQAQSLVRSVTHASSVRHD